MRAVKASILLFLALMCLAPVLRTLTAATSSDSIWAMAAALFILNALLADYTPMPGHARERCVPFSPAVDVCPAACPYPCADTPTPPA